MVRSPDQSEYEPPFIYSSEIIFWTMKRNPPFKSYVTFEILNCLLDLKKEVNIAFIKTDLFCPYFWKLKSHVGNMSGRNDFPGVFQGFVLLRGSR